MRRLLSPKELAQATGVSESSLKRWADEGLLTVTRTAGGHRRISLREAVRYIRKAGLPVLKPHLLGLADLAAVLREKPAPAGADAMLVDALKEGRSETARGLVLSMYLDGRSVAEICDGPLAAAMHEVGDLWRHGAEGIYIEHRALDLCVQSLDQLRNLFPPPPDEAPAALGGALDGDPYLLPSLMVATVLGSAGWRVTNLGPNLPVRVLLAAVERYRPALTWLSCSVDEAARNHEREVRKAAAALSLGGTKLVVGGRAWTFRRSDAELTTAGSMLELAAFAEGLTAASATH